MPMCVVCGFLEPDPPSHRPSDFKQLIFAKGRWWCKSHVSQSVNVPRLNIDYSKLRTETITIRMPVENAQAIAKSVQEGDQVDLDTALEDAVVG